MTRLRRTVDVERLRSALADARSGRVVFVSHCLLNENVRYLGGACRPGAVTELVDRWNADGVGICQLPCPEQRAWGGVMKPRLLSVYGASGSLRFRLRRPLTRVFMARTRRTYRRLAADVAAQIADYRSAGMTVVAVVGVAGSPSCGVTVAQDVAAAVEGLGRLDPASMQRDDVNAVVVGCAVPGEGLFVAELRRALRQRRIDVPFVEHDLPAELAGTRGGL